MNKRLAAVKGSIVLTCLVFSQAIFATDRSCGSTQEALNLDRNIDKAFLRQDIAFLSEVLDQGFTWVHSGAYPVDTKASTLATVKSHARHWQRQGMDVKLFDGVAIVSGYVSVIYATKIIAKAHMQRVYVQVNSGCTLVSQHVTMDLGEDNRNEILRYISENYWSK